MISNNACLIGIFLLLTGAFLLVVPAYGQVTVDVGVTPAMQEIINALDPGETLPSEPGQLVGRFKNISDAVDYVAAPQLILTVDTGWDMTDITDSTTITGESDPSAVTVFGAGETVTLQAGDSIVRAVEVANLGNNYVEIDFSAVHQALQGGDSFSLALYYADGSHVADDFDDLDPAPGEVTGAAGDIPGWTMGEVKTLFLVVEAESFATNQDAVLSRFSITNNAPLKTETGDGWERGIPLAEGVDDSYDTQSGIFWTKVSGPEIQLTKTQTAPDRRPGGVISYSITVVNAGNDTAYELQVVDAIPASTGFNGEYTAGQAAVYYETDLAGNNWTPIAELPVGEETTVEKLRWYYEEFPYETSGNHQDTIGFEVVIN